MVCLLGCEEELTMGGEAEDDEGEEGLDGAEDDDY